MLQAALDGERKQHIKRPLCDREHPHLASPLHTAIESFLISLEIKIDNSAHEMTSLLLMEKL
ncbi:MAG TPA: hypothetical protein VID27_15680 [Blastocatellia bacterium]|jgi:hypothetical protein